MRLLLVLKKKDGPKVSRRASYVVEEYDVIGPCLFSLLSFCCQQCVCSFCFPSFLTATRALNRPSCCVYCLGFVDFTHRSVVLWYSFILTGLLTDPKSSFVDWTVIFQLSATKLSISSHPFSTEEDILYILSLSICAIHEYDSMNIGFPFTFNE